MESRKLKRWLALAPVLLAVAPAVRAGEAPPAGPTSPSSARFTLGDIYSRLTTGAAGVKRVGAFTEPALGPATFTMHTTDQIMGAAPAADNTDGATAANVLAGKTFWGLRTSGGVWGLQTGTGTGASYAAGVPKTWQKKCWDSQIPANEIVGCTGTAVDGTPAAGQDGQLQKGVAYAKPRFTDSGKGTVTDNLTGLIWLKDANCAAVSPKSWAAGLTAVNALAQGACGLGDGSVAGDWRLPNLKEQLSLLDVNYFDPAVPNTLGSGKWTWGDPFTNMKFENYYWTSSTYVASPAGAWIVSLYDGTANFGGKGALLYIWPVRGGP